MKSHGIRACHKRRFKTATDSKHSFPVAPNLLKRNFTASTLVKHIWAADLTYIWTSEDWLYLAVILNLINREVVGWSLKPMETVDIVIDAPAMACFRKRPTPSLIRHSDRGSQYASHVDQARLKEYSITCSISRKGSCWVNATTESFFNRIKNEWMHGTSYVTIGEASADAFDYIEPLFNRKSKNSTLGCVSPQSYLANWLKKQQQLDLAA